MAIGSKSARMTWAEGLAFLTSAINWIGPGPARAARKSRTGGAAAGLVLHLLERHPEPGRGHLPPLRGDDLVEDGRRHSTEPRMGSWSSIRGSAPRRLPSSERPSGPNSRDVVVRVPRSFDSFDRGHRFECAGGPRASIS